MFLLIFLVQVSTVTLKHNNQQPVTEGQIEVTAGVPERLICELGHSRPTPTIDWYIKDDTNRKQRSTVSTYDLDANNEDHDKVIYCKAYNLQGAANGVVSTKPKLYVRGKNYIAKPTDTKTLCNSKEIVYLARTNALSFLILILTTDIRL